MFTGHSWVVAVVLILIVLIVFGPGKFGDLGGALGRTIGEFRKSLSRDSDAEKRP